MSRAIESPEEVESGIRFHYDLPPEFFALFLDKATMGYTCAYFREAMTPSTRPRSARSSWSSRSCS